MNQIPYLMNYYFFCFELHFAFIINEILKKNISSKKKVLVLY